MLKSGISERSFASLSQVRKTAIMTRVFGIVHEITSKGIHVTKRDLFYTDVKLFKKQEESDAVLDDVACTIGCPRTCLNVNASDKGLVVGRIQFDEDGDPIDCTRMGITGKAIPSSIDKITNIRSDAEFILLVEKDAAYQYISRAGVRFSNVTKRTPCFGVACSNETAAQPSESYEIIEPQHRFEAGALWLGFFSPGVVGFPRA